jgi:hypothetical protein
MSVASAVAFDLSVYIPIVNSLSEQQILEIFWNEFIGSVKRVDFFDAPNGNKSAFVHLHYWFEFKKFEIWDRINTYGSYRCMYNGNTNYLILRKMTCDPIPETTMNIHQVAALLSEHTAKIAELETIIAQQAVNISNYEQLISGTAVAANIWNHELMGEEDSLVSPRWEEEDDSGMVCVEPEEEEEEEEDFAMDCEETRSTSSGSGSSSSNVSEGSISRRMQMSMELCGNN